MNSARVWPIGWLFDGTKASKRYCESCIARLNHPYPITRNCSGVRLSHSCDQLFSEFSRRTRIDRAHKSSATDFCSSFPFGHLQRFTCRGCGSGSGSITSLASETSAALKSARATGCLRRVVPSKSPIFQISCPESLSLHNAEIFRVEGLGRNAPGFGFAGGFFL